MARANRYFTEGRHYHVTHRCHDGNFLLKFAKDRDTYRSMARARLDRFNVKVLGYCITSNHLHLVATAPHKYGLAGFMQSLAGDFAQAYNLRKKRSGAFWGDRYHACQIEGGDYLWNCLKYVDMNMVRAGVVGHPADWPWCGYQETSGMRQRYRLVDPHALLEALGDGMTMEDFSENYEIALREAIINREYARQAMWTEALAVGSKAFLHGVEKTLKNRTRTEYVEPNAKNAPWILREAGPKYS